MTEFLSGRTPPPSGWRGVQETRDEIVRPLPPFRAPPERAATRIFGVRLLL